MIEALQFDFMQNALGAGLLASVICGIIGTLVVVNRIVFLSGGIAHAAYGGIGLSSYFNWPYLPGTISFAVFAAILMAAVSHTMKHRADTIIGVIWAIGMAFGIILIDLTPGYNEDLMSYLFGSILAVPRSDLYIMAVIVFLMVVLIKYYYQELLAIPPFIVEKYSKSLLQMMVASSVLGACFTVTGLWFSYKYNLTSGASIIMVSGVVFLFSLLIDKIGFIGHRAKNTTKK